MSLSIADIRQMYANGYAPIALRPGMKKPFVDDWPEIAAVDPMRLWSGVNPAATNIGMYCGDLIIIVDGDAKDEAGLGITGRQVMDWLWEHRPELFEGCIREITAGTWQHRGSHTTYRWTPDALAFVNEGASGKTYGSLTHEDAEIIPEGTTVVIELLTRNSQGVCPPSTVAPPIGDGLYEYASKETHLNTKRSDLPELPSFFRTANRAYVQAKKDAQEKKRAESEARGHYKGRGDDNITTADQRAVVNGLVEAYSRGVVKGERHFNGLGLAQALASPKFGLSESDLRGAVEDYFRRAGRQPNQGEVTGIVKRAMERPDSEPPIPWTSIIGGRKATERAAREKLLEKARQVASGWRA